MQELQNLFNERVETFLKSGKVEEKIDTAISRCFDDCIDSAFRWGDLKKSVEKVISEKMQISLRNIDIQSYNAVLEQALREKMSKFSSESADNMFADLLSNLFEEAPKEISMMDLADKILESLRESHEGYGEYYHVELTNGYEYSYTFKIKEDSDKYSRSIVHLYLLDHDGHHIIGINHEMDLSNPTRLHGIDRYLFNLYAARTRITDVETMNINDLDTRKCDQDY